MYFFFLLNINQISFVHTTMNILPKKRWHVRTKDNIAKKNRDESAARELESQKQAKQQLSECEARLNFLRRSSSLTQGDYTIKEKSQNYNELQPVDLFKDYKHRVISTNKDFIKEKKEQQESYEKKIGCLTYLGQNTNEILKTKSWFEIQPRLLGQNNKVKHVKEEKFDDPLNKINTLKRRHTTNARHNVAVCNSGFADKSKKKYVFKSKCGVEPLQKLREERIKRESKEKVRQRALLNDKNITKETTRFLPVYKYHNQFNPSLAKQN